MFSPSRNKADNIESVILEKSNEIQRLQAEQRLMQYAMQFQKVTQNLQSAQDSEKVVLENEREKVWKKLESEIKEWLKPLRQELSELSDNYRNIVNSDIMKFIEIKNQIKSINGKSNQDDLERVKELENNLSAPNLKLDDMDVRMNALRDKIKNEKERVRAECINHYIDYDLLKKKLTESISSQSGFFLSREEQLLSLNSKEKKKQNIFRKEVVSQIDKINSPSTMLTFIMFLNLVSNNYKGGVHAVEKVYRTLVNFLNENTISLLDKMMTLEKDIVELKEKRTGHKPHLELVEEVQREIMKNDVINSLSQCFDLIKTKGKNNIKSDGIYPSKSDYEQVIEFFHSASSDKLENKL